MFRREVKKAFPPVRKSESNAFEDHQPDDKNDLEIESPNNGNGEKYSYYVWFLGAKESKGLRGAEYIRPVVRQLLERANDIKLTLQLSAKGLKIIQTPQSKHYNLENGLKQFIPHNCVTSVVRGEPPHDDVVSAILLISNSVKKRSSSSIDCPLFVHSYRCDSPETAEHLAQQLQHFVDRPENLAKFDEIENKLIEKGLILPRHVSGSKRPEIKNVASGTSSKMGSDGRSLGRSSDSGSEPLSPVRPPYLPHDSPDHLVTLYDSLAAELKEKLHGEKSKQQGPLLLPPRDYGPATSRDNRNFEAVEALRSLKSTSEGRKSTQFNSFSNTSSGRGIPSGDTKKIQHDNEKVQEEKEKIFDEDHHKSSSDDDWPNVEKNRPLVTIQAYSDRKLRAGNANESQAMKGIESKGSNIRQQKPKYLPSHAAKKEVNRTNSFHEIQHKFRNLDMRKPDEQVDKVWTKAFKEETTNNKNNKGGGRGAGDEAGALLETYFTRQHSAPKQAPRIKRQPSKCSTGSGLNSNSGDAYKRNMEAVGEFEKVWAWKDDLNNNNNNNNNNNDEKLESRETKLKRDEKRQFQANRSHVKNVNDKKMFVPSSHKQVKSAKVPLKSGPPPNLSSALRPKRVDSPELVRRSNSKVAMLRREKTSFMEGRHLSMDNRIEQQPPFIHYHNHHNDPRRRSYHELNDHDFNFRMNMALPHPHHGRHNFQHSGKKVKEPKKKSSTSMSILPSFGIAHPPHFVAATPAAFPHHHGGPPPPGPFGFTPPGPPMSSIPPFHHGHQMPPSRVMMPF